MTTSSSDNEMGNSPCGADGGAGGVNLESKIHVGGLPLFLDPSDIRQYFQDCGYITAIKSIPKKGLAFIHFESEAAARTAIELKDKSQIAQGFKIRVALARCQKRGIPSPRLISFPRPFIGVSSGGGGPMHLSPSAGRITNNRNNYRRRHPPLYHKIIYDNDMEEKKEEENSSELSPLPQNCILKLIRRYPHIARKIFGHLDRVTLIRATLVSDEIRYFVTNLLNQRFSTINIRTTFESGRIKPIKPHHLIPEVDNKNKKEGPYRNVLALKADHSEIIIALDNGNVEIYDRYSLNRICTLVKDYVTSPDKLDFDSKIIVVGYNIGLFRNSLKSMNWTIYDRETKEILQILDRCEKESIKLGNDFIYRVKDTQVFRHYHHDLKNSVKLFESVTKIEAFDLAENSLVYSSQNDDKQHYIYTLKLSEEKNSNINPNHFLLLPGDFKPEIKNLSTMSLQVDWPYALIVMSNNNGFFEIYESRGRPYVFLILVNLIESKVIRIITIDNNWLCQNKFDPIDSCLRSSKFNHRFLIVGLGSLSDSNDGGIRIFNMEEILDPNVKEPNTTSITCPFYHLNDWDGHIGCISCLHLDDISLIAANSCLHQVSSRCIYNVNETTKDNIIVYDFPNSLSC